MLAVTLIILDPSRCQAGEPLNVTGHLLDDRSALVPARAESESLMLEEAAPSHGSPRRCAGAGSVRFSLIAPVPLCISADAAPGDAGTH